MHQVNQLREIFHASSRYYDDGNVVQLSNEDCIAAYGSFYTTGRDHVLLVTVDDGDSANGTMFDQKIEFYWDYPNNWICDGGIYGLNHLNSGDCDINKQKRNATGWTIRDMGIDYCLSHKVPSHCKLEFSLYILEVIVVCNVLKSVVVVLTLSIQDDTTLVTMGDAVASFLTDGPRGLGGRCFLSTSDAFSRGTHNDVAPGIRTDANIDPVACKCSSSGRRWFTAVSAKRWTMTVSLCALAVAAGVAFFRTAVWQVHWKGGSIYNLGFGAVDQKSFIRDDIFSNIEDQSAQLLSAVLLANLPQAIVSALYFIYNSLVTSLLLGAEWSKFEHVRKPLRVSTPQGQQRSTYYLQLPYRYSVPLMVGIGTLHWLISQSFFLVSVIYVKDSRMIYTSPDISSTTTIGFSCTAILASTLLGSAMLAALIALGFRRYKGSMPVAGSCSLAIAAACVRPDSDIDAAIQPVKWGEVDADNNKDVGHCCFASLEVSTPIPGKLYAGRVGDYVQKRTEEKFGKNSADRRDCIGFCRLSRLVDMKAVDGDLMAT